MKTDCVHVDFRSKYGVLSITLYSRFTCIIGLDSGEGKSKLLADITDNAAVLDASITNDKELPVSIIDTNTFDIKAYQPNTIIIMDEVSASSSLQLLSLCKEDMFFIMICRSLPIKNTYPLKGIYHIAIAKNWYRVVPSELPIYTESDIDVIVTEAEEHHSEYELLEQYFSSLIAACGRDKIVKALRKAHGNVLVLADLCNIGNAYTYWLAYCKRCGNIHFYDYQSFEQLLLESPLVSSVSNELCLSPFSCNSLEEFFDKKLTYKVANTELAYTHGKPLAAPYLDKTNFKKIFDSDVGRALIPLLSNGTEQFDAVVYLQNKAGDKFKYFTQIQIDNCQTQEDCDQLLQSLRWLD